MSLLARVTRRAFKTPRFWIISSTGGHPVLPTPPSGSSPLSIKKAPKGAVFIVRERGLEPPRLTTHAPQACLATKLQHSRINKIIMPDWDFFSTKNAPPEGGAFLIKIYSLVSATSSTSIGVSISTPLVTCSRSSSSSFGDFLRTIPRIRRRISLAALSRIK